MNHLQQYGLKDLENVVIKTTSDIEVNGKIIKKNETIAAFDSIQIANLEEQIKRFVAHGGLYDAPRVFWEYPESVNLIFAQGIFSATQLALMTNSKLITVDEETPIYIDYCAEMESDENGTITLEDDCYDYFFIYDKDNGEKVEDYTVDGHIIGHLAAYHDYIVNYAKQYITQCEVLHIGSQLTDGFLTLQGKTRVKDDITGLVRTGIITIPKLKLMTGLSMRLGQNAEPIVGQFSAKALPVGSKGNTKIVEIAFLNDNIDSDI